MILRHTPFDDPTTQLGMQGGDSEYSAVELGELASSASRLLTACLGAKHGGRLLALDSHDQFLLDQATRMVENVLTGLRFLAAHDLASPGPDGIMLCNCVVQTLLNQDMGTGKELKTMQDLQAYFEGIALVLRKVRASGTLEVAGRQLALAQRFFLELANTLPFEQSDDETRVTIAMEEALLRELKRVAQKEGMPVPKLVAEIILSHLNGGKETEKASKKSLAKLIARSTGEFTL
jgi:predicted DNA binding CopG/RHH family protein